MTQFIPIEHEFDHPQQLRGDFPALPRIDFAVQFNSFVQLFRFRLKNSVDGKRDGGGCVGAVQLNNQNCYFYQVQQIAHSTGNGLKQALSMM